MAAVNTCIFYAVVLLFTNGIVESKVRIDPRRNDVNPSPAASTTTAASKEASYRTFFEEELSSMMSRGPHFAPDSPKKVMAAVGSPAHVPCKVRNLGSKSVSWIRNRDLQVLTVGSFIFTTDDRFSAHRDPTSGDWVLVIRRPLPEDSGFYECSISSKPATTHAIQLKVVVPSAELLSKTKKVYLDEGSTLNLTCVVHFSPTAPEFVLWYKEDKLVDYRIRGKNISVITTHFGEVTKSSLLVKYATVDDSGQYSCQPSNANTDSVYVHVLKSETPAAMQTTTTNSKGRPTPAIGLAFLSFYLSMACFQGQAYVGLVARSISHSRKISFRGWRLLDQKI